MIARSRTDRERRERRWRTRRDAGGATGGARIEIGGERTPEELLRQIDAKRRAHSHAFFFFFTESARLREPIRRGQPIRARPARAATRPTALDLEGARDAANGEWADPKAIKRTAPPRCDTRRGPRRALYAIASGELLRRKRRDFAAGRAWTPARDGVVVERTLGRGRRRRVAPSDLPADAGAPRWTPTATGSATPLYADAGPLHRGGARHGQRRKIDRCAPRERPRCAPERGPGQRRPFRTPDLYKVGGSEDAGSRASRRCRRDRQPAPSNLRAQNVSVPARREEDKNETRRRSDVDLRRGAKRREIPTPPDAPSDWPSVFEPPPPRAAHLLLLTRGTSIRFFSFRTQQLLLICRSARSTLLLVESPPPSRVELDEPRRRCSRGRARTRFRPSRPGNREPVRESWTSVESNQWVSWEDAVSQTRS